MKQFQFIVCSCWNHTNFESYSQNQQFYVFGWIDYVFDLMQDPDLVFHTVIVLFLVIFELFIDIICYFRHVFIWIF